MAHKHPREVRFVDAVPLSSVGKTDRKAVRSLLASLPQPSTGARSNR